MRRNRYFSDLTDQKFGRLTAKYVLDEKASNGERLWFCECECGGTKIVKSSHLRYGNCQSCGCIRNKKIAGQKFNKLTAIKSRKRDDGRVVWLCKCDCGNKIEVLTADLLNGLYVSCGCTGSRRKKHRVIKNYNENIISDFSGKRFNEFVVLGPTKKRYFEDVVWRCKCDCGKIFYEPTSFILNNKIKTCGHLHKEHNEKFGTTRKIMNKYIFNQIGIGYTVKGEKFYFDKEDFDKIKNYCWRFNEYGTLIAHDPEAWPKKKRVIACWRVIFNEKGMTKKIKYKKDKWDLRKKNLEVV